MIHCFFHSRPAHRDLHSFPTRRSSDLVVSQRESVKNDKPTISMSLSHCIHQTLNSKASTRSEERFSRNAETELVCRLLLEKKKHMKLRGKLLTLTVQDTLEATGTMLLCTDVRPAIA